MYIEYKSFTYVGMLLGFGKRSHKKRQYQNALLEDTGSSQLAYMGGNEEMFRVHDGPGQEISQSKRIS